MASGERKPLGAYSEDEDEDAVTIGGSRRGYRKFLRGTLRKKKKKWKGGMCPWEQESSRKGVPSFCEAADGTSCAFNENAAFLQSGKDARDGVGHALRFPIEDLFYKYGVDLAFYGHEHEYWRTFPVYDEKVVNGTDAQLLLLGANEAGKSDRPPATPQKRSVDEIGYPKKSCGHYIVSIRHF